MALAAAVIMGLATACQVVAPRLKVPSLVLLLPVGFLLGVMAPQIGVELTSGSAFPAVVDLIVAVILFQGGLELTDNPISAKDHPIVRRLVWIGGAVTFVAAAGISYVLLGLEWPMAFMLGAIVIVSGPTVVTPILDFARMHGRVRGILQWEGTLLDPIGALVAVVVLQIVKASGADSPSEAAALFFGGLAVGIVAAAIGVVLFVVGGKLVGGNDLLGTQVLLGSVIVAAGLANFVSQESGLLAALLMGMAAPRIARRFGASLDRSRPFFNTVVSIGIGLLFIAIAALVPAAMSLDIVVPALAMTALLMLVVRPVVVIIATAGTNLTRQQRTFMAWMDPRGIVAVATASGVGPVLIALNQPGAERLLPAAFIIVAVTVAVYGLTAIPVSRMLGLSDAKQTTPVP